MSNKVIIDLEGLVATKSFNKCLKLCEKLGLVETMDHGEHSYARMTQEGVNVMCTLLQMASNSADPRNRMKAS